MSYYISCNTKPDQSSCVVGTGGCLNSSLLARYVVTTMRMLQLLAEVKATLRHYVTIEYNATATYSSETRSRTHRLTVAWDALQTQVPTNNSIASC